LIFNVYDFLIHPARMALKSIVMHRLFGHHGYGIKDYKQPRYCHDLKKQKLNRVLKQQGKLYVS